MYELARRFFTSSEGHLFVLAFNLFSLAFSIFVLWYGEQKGDA